MFSFILVKVIVGAHKQAKITFLLKEKKKIFQLHPEKYKNKRFINLSIYFSQKIHFYNAVDQR
jgi:hypothetical protein